MRLIGRKIIYSGWGRFWKLDVALGDGRPAERQLEDHGEAASVLPYDAARRTALLDQVDLVPSQAGGEAQRRVVLPSVGNIPHHSQNRHFPL